VSPGTYLVINHSTGERFTDVTVSGTSTPAPTGISVVGGTISWPDDGWYQVQTADGSATICNGGSSCEVDPGQYLLINHTTGQRFPGVVVSEGAGPPRPPAIDAVTVTGNVITMPEDGWYQVQTADGSESVCNGETSCEVPAGRYLVINHTTGERFEDIVVGGSTPVTPPSGVDSVTVDGTSVRWPDDGWYQVQNADTFESVCEGGVSCDVAPGTYFVINLSTGERQTVSVEDGTSPPAGSEAVEVSLDIMVPAYSSEALQVRVMSGDARVNAAFVVDESWSVTAELAANTDYPLSVVFFDDNGAITLASVETRFTTSSDEVQEFQITADQFDSDRWDTDGDGTSNLDELRAGRDPLVADTPGAVDSDFRITVANGDSGALSVSVGVPDPESGQLGGDFMILFDRSGSFGDDLATFRREVDDIELALSDNFSNFRIGLASFVDAPCRDFGSGSDFGYELNLPMGRPGMLSEALDELDIRFGNDGPESQLEAMRQAMTGEGHIVDSALSPSCSPVANIMATSPGWTDDRVKFLLVSTDAEFHRPTDFEYPYQTTVQDVINLASESKTTILFLNSGSTDVAAGEIVFATGGLVSNLGSASQEIVSVLKSAVASTISSVEVFMEPVGDGAEFVTSIEPDRVELNLFEDRNVEFQVNLLPELEPSAIDRVFTFELVTEAQGAEISRLTVELTVPAD
jgi:hypothetical protein